jgi:hypothetical protein
MNTISGLALVDSEPGNFALYLYKNVMIFVWFSQATNPTMLRLTKVIQSLVEAYPEGVVSLVHIIADHAAVPTPEARAGFNDFGKQYAKNIACASVVLRGSGFHARAMRAAITDIRMIAPQSFPLRVHNSMEEVAEWLPEENLRRTGIHVDPHKLINVLNAAQLQQVPSAPLEKK